MRPNEYPQINTLIDSLKVEIQRVLGENFAGLHLYGSLVTGDFDLDTSDIDLLAVTSSDLEERELASLHAMHIRFARANPIWEDRIEVAYVPTQALTSFRVRNTNLAIISPGEPFHVKEAGNDWLINWYIVREQGLALYGPPPQAIIAPISKEEFIQAVRSQVREWGEWVSHCRERKAQAYAILTMCRALFAVEVGEQVSKRRAAVWAADILPDWSPLIQQALIWRDSWREAPVDHAATYPETERFVHFVRDRIDLDNL